MLTRTVSLSAPNPFPPQEPYLAIELAPRDQAEQACLHQVHAVVQAQRVTSDLRSLAAEVRRLLGAGYLVGSGTAHIWVLREGESQRLAIIADALTTSYKSCPQAWEPLTRRGAPARHRRRRKGK